MVSGLYYDPPSKEVKKVVEYQADEVIYEKEYTAKADKCLYQRKNEIILEREYQC